MKKVTKPEAIAAINKVKEMVKDVRVITPMVLDFQSGARTLTMSMEDVKEMFDVFEENTGVLLEHEQLRSILQQDDRVARDVQEYGANDTEVRGRLVDLLCQWLNLPKWPTYRDGKEAHQAFVKRFDETAKARGLKVVS